MTKLVLIRKHQEYETLGKMFVFDGLDITYQCLCLELPWLNNEHNISCIPEGTYDVIKYSDTKHKNCFWIQDVPDRDGILIHKGNWVTGNQIDSKGCLLVGTDWLDIDQNGTIDVIHPDIALGNLNLYLPDKFKLYIV